jgi:ubiquinone/menaquinone biosynthesis C-methylase UbiE
VDEQVRAYYERGVELGRLEQGYSRIEFERTKELLDRHLPPTPASVLDVGGGPGVYAEWLAERGFEVHLVDGSPLHVEEATRRGAGRFTAALGDARALDERDAAFDAVLLMGPLYHLTERGDRIAALREARRVVRTGGVLVATAISRFASLLDGLQGGYLHEPAFSPIVERDLADGQHRSADNAAFTTAFFHRVDELEAEVHEAGLGVEGVYGVEGPGWLMRDAWDDEQTRANVLRVARVLEQEPTTIGVSSHLLVVARR